MLLLELATYLRLYLRWYSYAELFASQVSGLALVEKDPTTSDHDELFLYSVAPLT